MKKRALLALGSFIVIFLVAFSLHWSQTPRKPLKKTPLIIANPHPPSPSPQLSKPLKAPNKPKTPAFSPLVTEHTPDKRLNSLPDGRVEFTPSIKASQTVTSETDTLERIGVIETILGDYRFAFKENPIAGENEEVVAQLLGKNPKNVVYLAQNSSLLKAGKLIDTWGSPFFFHAQSSKKMEIISPGADQELWTTDDITSEDF